jgi:hypothetical protein
MIEMGSRPSDDAPRCDARQNVYEGSGHSPHLAEPNRVVTDVGQFLFGAGSGPAAEAGGRP